MWSCWLADTASGGTVCGTGHSNSPVFHTRRTVPECTGDLLGAEAGLLDICTKRLREQGRQYLLQHGNRRADSRLVKHVHVPGLSMRSEGTTA